MRLQGVFTVVSLGIIAACSSGGGTVTTPSTQSQGQTTGGTGAPIDAPDTNPDGVPYPTANIGTKPSTDDPSKNVVGKPGNIMANFKFYGYPNGDPTAGLQPVALADFYDPTNKKWKLLHIQAAGEWCIWCQRETESTVPIYSTQLEPQGIAWLTAVVEGATQGSPATNTTLNSWVADFKPDFPNVVDPGNHNFGVFFSEGALPWNADLDAATMEILDANVGAPSADGTSVTQQDVLNEVVPWLAFLKAHPADPTTGLRQ
jgi:hypothetical protein